MKPAEFTASSPTSNLFSSALQHTVFNAALNALFRLSTFILNAWVLRHVTKSVLGQAAQLTLLYSTVTFFAREPFRKACVSAPSTQSQLRSLIDLLWLAPWFGLAWSVVLIPLWSLSLPTMEVCLYAGSAMVELLTEPLQILLQIHLVMGRRVAAEGWAQLARCVFVGVGVTLSHSPDWSIRVYSVGQLIYGCVLLAVISALTVGSASSIETASPNSNSEPLDPAQTALVRSFLGQCAVKQLLTEGEKYVLTFTNLLSLAEQGLLDSVSNLGSLAARLLFQPVEEGAYHFFGKSLRRGQSPEQQDPDRVTLAGIYLRGALRLVSLIGWSVALFSVPYSTQLLHLYSGATLSEGEGPNLLRLFSCYVLLLAWNGVSEAFMFATMSRVEVDSHNRRLVGYSVAFLATAVAATTAIRRIGPALFGVGEELACAGFVLANCVNIGLRAASSLVFAGRYVRGKDDVHGVVGWLLPCRQVRLVMIGAFVVTCCSNLAFTGDHRPSSQLCHLTMGANAFLLVVTACLAFESDLSTLASQLPAINRLKSSVIGRHANRLLLAVHSLAAVGLLLCLLLRSFSSKF
uniref:Protein RFT1 homolog n=1 Tax=Macrostomum lignano TaxID=282301 RepID=A0A1I8H019_9PLAT